MSGNKKSLGRRTVMVRRPNPLAKKKELEETVDAPVSETLKLHTSGGLGESQTAPESYLHTSEPAAVTDRSERGLGDATEIRRGIAVARPVIETSSASKKGTFEDSAVTHIEPQTLAVGLHKAGARRDMNGAVMKYTILGNPDDYDQRCPEDERMPAEVAPTLTSSLLDMQRGSDQGSEGSYGGRSVMSHSKKSGRRGSFARRGSIGARSQRRGSIARTIKSEAKTVRTSKSKMSGAGSAQEENFMDQSADERQTRALELWDDYQDQREALRQHLLQVRGNKSGEPVMFSGDEFREKIEEYDLLEKAMPREEKYRDNLWFMSLRDSWARFIPLGSIFSGLFCVVREKSLAEKAFTVVGNPRNKSLVNTKLQHTIARDGTVHKFHTRDGPESVPKMSWVNMDAIWAKERHLKGNVKELLPFRVDMEGLEVVGSNGIDSELPEPEYDDEDAEEGGTVISKLSHPTQKSGKSSKHKHGAPTDTGVGAVGPCLELKDPNIAFNSGPDKVATQRACVENTGTAAVHYRWEKIKKEGKLGMPLRGIDPPGGGFWCCDEKGVLQPGSTVEFPFAFKSHLCGIYTATFKMHTTPPMPESVEPLVVNMRGVVTQPDENGVKRALLEQHLEHNSVLHGIQDVIMEAIRRVELKVESKGAAEQPPEQARIDAKLFARANTKVLVKRDVPCVPTQVVSYEPGVLQELRDIVETTKACAQIGDKPPTPPMLTPREQLEAKLTPRAGVYDPKSEKPEQEESWEAEWTWDYSMEQLGFRQVTILDETKRAEELGKLDRVTERAIYRMHRPNALYPPAVDAVMELAENIEKVACQTRRRIGLSPKDFVAPGDDADAAPAKGKDAKKGGADEEEQEDDPELVADYQDALYAKVRALLCAAVDQFANCAGDVMAEEAERRGEGGDD